MAEPAKPQFVSFYTYYEAGLHGGNSGAASLNATVSSLGSAWIELYIQRSPLLPWEYVMSGRTGKGAGVLPTRAFLSKYYQLFESPSADFKAVAYSLEGEVSVESDVFTATVIVPEFPSVPVNVLAEQQDGKLVKISWNEVTYYTTAIGILRSETNDVDSAIMVGYANGENKDFGTLDNFFIDSGAEYGKTYYYWLWSQNSRMDSSDYSSVASVTMSDGPAPPPTPPSPLRLRRG